MRYPKHHKEEARRNLLDRGGRHAKKHGFAGSGVDALAAAAGVTTGSLYKHFGGKSDLFAAIVRNELEQAARMYGAIEAGDRDALIRLLRSYLGTAHVEHPERGCVLPTLTSEVARADQSVRATFETGLGEIHAMLERATGSGDRAWALLAQMVGAVMLARAMSGDEARRRLLTSVQRNCVSMLPEVDR